MQLANKNFPIKMLFGVATCMRLVLGKWTVQYVPLDNAHGGFAVAKAICAARFIEPSYSAVRINVSDHECHGMPRDWTPNLQIETELFTMVKHVAMDTYNPPLHLSNNVDGLLLYRTLIPGKLEVGSRVVFKLQPMADQMRIALVLSQDGMGTWFRMQCFMDESIANFNYKTPGVTMIESRDINNVTSGRKFDVEFLLLPDAMLVFVDGSEFYTWQHHIPAAVFDMATVRIHYQNLSGDLFLHGVIFNFTAPSP